MPNYPIYAETIHRWLSSLDQRLSPLRATDSSQFDQNENVLRRSSPTILYNVASSENIILQRSCARRVFLQEKRSRFLGQEKKLSDRSSDAWGSREKRVHTGTLL